MKGLKECDSELFNLIQEEKDRQTFGLELIASENFTSRAVMECLGSCLTNKYSEGYPGKRYYGGTEVIDKIESLCQKRSYVTFHIDEKDWGVNVQPYSGSPANMEVYTGLLEPHDRIMGLDLPSGGHLTHGFRTASKKVSASSIFFESMPYRVDENTGLLNYDEIAERVAMFHPKILICGGSAYPRDWNYARLRKIADENDAILMCDMAHFSGLVASQVVQSPFDYCDIVTSTTHKTLRGPRSGLIFFRRGIRKYEVKGKPKEKNYEEFEAKINSACFPGLQGGPHNHQIAAVATCLKEAAEPSFKEYAKEVVSNAKVLADVLMGYGYTLVSGGTDTHLILWDLRPEKLSGSKAEKLFDRCAISLNKNTVHGDKSAFNPGGLRLGSSALTTRGFKTEDFKKVGEYLHRGVQIGIKYAKEHTKLVDFVAALDSSQELADLKKDVVDFSSKFEMPGRVVE